MCLLNIINKALATSRILQVVEEISHIINFSGFKRFDDCGVAIVDVAEQRVGISFALGAFGVAADIGKLAVEVLQKLFSVVGDNIINRGADVKIAQRNTLEMEIIDIIIINADDGGICTIAAGFGGAAVG